VLHPAFDGAIQLRSGCAAEQSRSLPVLEVAAVALKCINLLVEVVVQTKTGRYVDQGLAPSLPVLEVAAVVHSSV
jgi:hypothetical protein